MRLPLVKDVTLSTGRVIKHRYLANNAQEAYPADTGPGTAMTDAEWAEYTSLRLERIANTCDTP